MASVRKGKELNFKWHEKKNDKMTTGGREGPFKVIVLVKDTLNSGENIYCGKHLILEKENMVKVVWF